MRTTRLQIPIHSTVRRWTISEDLIPSLISSFKSPQEKHMAQSRSLINLMLLLLLPPFSLLDSLRVGIMFLALGHTSFLVQSRHLVNIYWINDWHCLIQQMQTKTRRHRKWDLPYHFTLPPGKRLFSPLFLFCSWIMNILSTWNCWFFFFTSIVKNSHGQ